MYQSFTPGNSFNGSAYTSSLILNSLSLYDMTSPFQIFQGPNKIFSLSPGTIQISGNLTISGTLTTNATVINTYNSGLIHLASGNMTDSVDIGIYGEYVSGSTVYSGIVRDSSDARKPWVVFKNITALPTTVINSGTPIADVNLDNLKARSLSVVAGTAASPTLFFTTAIDTGLFYTGSSIAFTLAGAQKLGVSSSAVLTSNTFTTTQIADSTSSTDSTASIVTAGGISAAKTINCLSLGAGSLICASANITSLISSNLSISSISTSSLSATGTSTMSNVSIVNLQVTGSATLASLSLQGIAGTTGSFSTSITTPLLTGTTVTATTLNATTCNLGPTTISGALTISNPGVNNITGSTIMQNVSASLGNFTRVVTSSVNTSSGASDSNASLVSSGGLSVATNANFGSNVYVGGNLIVSGSTVSTQGSNKITGVETNTTVSLNTLKCAIECNNTGAVLINLPAFSATYKGKEFFIVSFSGSITIAPAGSDTLNGVAASLVLSGSANTKISILGIESGWWTF